MTLIIYMGSWDYFSKFSIIVTIFFIVIAAYITKPFFSTILFSFFVAYLLVPLYTFLENRTKHRRIAAASSVFLTIILFFLIGIRIIYFILTQISSLLNSPESVQTFIRNGTNETIKIIEANFPFFSFNVGSEINQLISDLIDAYFPPIKNVIIFFTATLSYYIIAFIIGLILSYYLLLTGNRLIDQILKFVPDKNKEEVNLFFKELDTIYSGLFRQHFISSVIAGAIALLGFYLLDVPYSSLWALLIFILSMCPLIGQPAVYLPLAAYYALLHDYRKALLILIFSTALHTLQDYYLRPKLAQEKGEVHPVITILAFVSPILVMGLTGLVIGPAVYGFLLALFRTKLRLKERDNEIKEKTLYDTKLDEELLI